MQRYGKIGKRKINFSVRELGLRAPYGMMKLCVRLPGGLPTKNLPLLWQDEYCQDNSWKDRPSPVKANRFYVIPSPSGR